jgi:plasmid stability protein
MKRTLVQLDEETYRKLRQLAFRQERSVSSVVREMVVQGLRADAGRNRPTRVNQFSSVRAGRSRQGRLSPISEKHDEVLAAAFDK